jgi:hypothetical protein
VKFNHKGAISFLVLSHAVFGIVNKKMIGVSGTIVGVNHTERFACIGIGEERILTLSAYILVNSADLAGAEIRDSGIIETEVLFLSIERSVFFVHAEKSTVASIAMKRKRERG